MHLVRTSALVAAALCSAPAAAQARAFGESCPGSLGRAPAVTTSGTTVAGTNFSLHLDPVAKNAPFLFVVGVSHTTWAGAALPLDMSAFGFPGCFLNVSYERAFGLTSDNDGRFVLPVPGTGALAGVRLYAQIVVPDGPGIAASKGYEVTVHPSVAPYKVVVLPDTQSYVVHDVVAQGFYALTQWVVDHLLAENLAFVSHVGDVVEVGAAGPNRNKAQWDRAETAMVKLDGDLRTRPDGLIPYAVSAGNRDYDVINDKTAATRFDEYFGPLRFAGRSWSGTAGPDGRSSFQIFTASGVRYLHLSLEWRPRDEVITWARRILTAHEELPAILTTHQYLARGLPFDDNGGTVDGTGDNGGTDVRHKLVEPFPQVFLVLCGHNLVGWHRSSETVLGQPVYEALVDYSIDPNGGNGWMNAMEFRPDTARIVNSCFSPIYVPGVTLGRDRRFDPDNNGVFPIDLHAHRRALETTRAVRFTGGHDDGHGRYDGAVDTFVSSAATAAAFGSRSDLEVDDPIGPEVRQGLLKFGGIFGTGAGRVPRNRPIVQAILTVTTEGPNAASNSPSRLYRLKVPFDESSTWNSLGNGIQVGTETEVGADADTGSLVQTKGTRSIDVTKSLRAWQSGAANHGWVLVNSGDGGWSFRSREWPAAAERPMLTVIFEK